MAARLFCPLLLVAVAVYPSMAAAFKNIQADQICIAETGMVPSLKPAPIPVGCELIDCCPGCPAARSLDWRISVDTKILDGAELRFEAPAGDLKTLQITGNAKLEGDRIIFARGNSTIKDVPIGAAGKVPVGLLLPVASKDSLSRLSKRADASSVIDYITVQQFLGSVPVNTFRWQLSLRPCGTPKAAKAMMPSTAASGASSSSSSRERAQDKLSVAGIPTGESAVVMMDARMSSGAGGCANDRAWITTGETSLGNVRASGGCNSEIAVFGTNTAMLLQSPVNTWTDNRGDVHTIAPPLGPPIPVPVKVWIANSDLTCDTNPAPAEYLANANTVYTNNKVGVRFVPNPACQNVSSDANAVTAIMQGIGTPGPGGAVACGLLSAVQNSGYYVAGQLNVYYVKGDFPGRSCAIRTTPEDTTAGDGNIIYIGSGPIYPPNLATLAHEFGHAFGLRPADHGPTWQGGGHVNPNGVALPGFDNTNVMWGGGPPTRKRFSVGQVFRMNTHSDLWGGTMLIKNNLSTLAPRPCHPMTASSACPELRVAWP